MGRVGLAVGGAVLVLLGGVALTWGPLATAEERTTALDGIDRVELVDGSGDVQVRYVPGARGQVVQRVHRWGAAFWGGGDAVEHRVEDGALVLDADCGWNCSVDYEVTLPVPVPVTGDLGAGSLHVVGMREVRAEVGSGEIEVAQVDGPVDVRTGSGSIILDRLTGEVDATTGSGDIEGRGLSAADLVLDTDAGSIDLRMTTAPTSAELTTGSGDIELTVPAESYRVDSDSGAGDVNVDVAEDPQSPRHLKLSTGSGDIRVRGV
ncbi:hypothetical protein GCM10011581_41760 [Saccharopolyspora subtropica]|uniref:DUF2807 domain-containing protein n=1 Tax=Saccharopolyspora thermophila TaxID=89367 RepID=A0A917K717_9PSEU|nr:DUF4097 family beta strand repeat-containing protein [Saccharopolyspora subtropica]GGJ00335.1 hypothetical protein GCM10011581_41760 [Saccharopolyspora subtropica]